MATILLQKLGFSVGVLKATEVDRDSVGQPFSGAPEDGVKRVCGKFSTSNKTVGGNSYRRVFVDVKVQLEADDSWKTLSDDDYRNAGLETSSEYGVWYDQHGELI